MRVTGCYGDEEGRYWGDQSWGRAVAHGVTSSSGPRRAQGWECRGSEMPQVQNSPEAEAGPGCGSAPCLSAPVGAPRLRALPQGLCWSWGHPRTPLQGLVVGRLVGEKFPGTWLEKTLKGSLHLWGARIWGGGAWRSRFQRAGFLCLPGWPHYFSKPQFTELQNAGRGAGWGPSLEEGRVLHQWSHESPWDADVLGLARRLHIPMNE